MSADRTFDRIVRTWLAEGPDQLSDRVLEAALAEVQVTQQGRLLPLPRALNRMPVFTRLAAAVLIGAVALGAGYLNRPGQGGVGGDPTPSPTASPTGGATAAPSAAPSPTPAASPTAVAAPIPLLTETHTSALGYFSIGVATSMSVEATGGPGDQPNGFVVVGSDLYLMRVGSVALPAGAVVDEWIEKHLTHGTPVDCGASRAALPEVVIDGQAGKIRDSCREVEATVVIDGRVYLLTLFAEDPPLTNGRAIFDAFAATVRFHPEDAPPLPSPAAF